MIKFDIPYYQDFISARLGSRLMSESIPVTGVVGVRQVGDASGLETPMALEFVAELYRRVKSDLATVLARRTTDRQVIDREVAAAFQENMTRKIDFLDPAYRTPVGIKTADGRVVFGPMNANYCRAGGKAVAAIPDFLQGPHVTLFGPPDSAKMAINAMNAYHRKLKGEPAIVAEILASESTCPMWGADDEDSKTPIRSDLVEAAVNLAGCFDETLRLDDPESGRSYRLADSHRAKPIKRFPGLALPCTFMFVDHSPLPLHLYDFAIHLYRNWKNPKALTFYVPKLENEEEAGYIATMIRTAEAMIQAIQPSYKLGTVRVMIVLENPRAILRTHEIMDALHPYFVGGSLGWHDYLAATARVFKEDGNYRIPVKADPNIVIKYIKASHSLLADVVGSRGGVKVGGMYGILPQDSDLHSPSFQVTLKGFFKDVLTQLKRDLTGFWVAHPDFVRIGIALVVAWKRRLSGDEAALHGLIDGFLGSPHREQIHAFVAQRDIEGLDKNSPGYVRSLLVADIKESDYIANNHPDEVRYNVFQTLQYLADWLRGNGCVALPTTIEKIPVRVMDDLATTERSRWEVWHEIYHGRFSVEDFLNIAAEEYQFIKSGKSTDQKIVQVKYDSATEKWYPIAYRLMVILMTDRKPVEFATELLMAFTVESIRKSVDPWAEVVQLDPQKYHREIFTYAGLRD